MPTAGRQKWCFRQASRQTFGSLAQMLAVTMARESTIFNQTTMVYSGYYKVMSNIPKMGQLPTPDQYEAKSISCFLAKITSEFFRWNLPECAAVGWLHVFRWLTIMHKPLCLVDEMQMFRIPILFIIPFFCKIPMSIGIPILIITPLKSPGGLHSASQPSRWTLHPPPRVPFAVQRRAGAAQMALPQKGAWRPHSWDISSTEKRAIELVN